MLIRNAVEEIGEKPYGGGIQPPPPVRRRVNTPPNNRGISLVKDPQFVLSNQMLDAKKNSSRKTACKTQPTNRPLSWKILKSSKTVKFFYLLFFYFYLLPCRFLRNVWFLISLFWCRRGFEGQRSLKRAVLYLVKMRRATILSQWRITKPQKNTKAVSV